jgi:hypothetical protein
MGVSHPVETFRFIVHRIPGGVRRIFVEPSASVADVDVKTERPVVGVALGYVHGHHDLGG